MGYNLSWTVGILLFTVSAVGTADWPNWRGPSHNGISSETGWKSQWSADIKILWRGELGRGFASMAVAQGKVYAMGNKDGKDFVYCLDALTGKEIWNYSYPCQLYDNLHEGGPCATPSFDNGRVYTLSKAGHALCLEAQTGRLIWSRHLADELKIKPPTWQFAGSPFIYKNLVIYNAGTSGLALNKDDGSVVWLSGTEPCGYATAVIGMVGGRQTLVLAGSREIFGIEPETGKVLWHYPWRTDWDINAADPIIADQMVFVSSGYNKGCALLKVEADRAEPVWTNKAMRNQINSSVLWEGYLYGFDGQVGGGGRLACIQWSTGKTIWTAGGMGTGSLILADGKLIILSENGKLIIANADPAGFKELASSQILTGKCWTSPVLANGLLYARNADGRIVCVDLRQ